jgi:hypothetical protein
MYEDLDLSPKATAAELRDLIVELEDREQHYTATYVRNAIALIERIDAKPADMGPATLVRDVVKATIDRANWRLMVAAGEPVDLAGLVDEFTAEILDEQQPKP